MNHYSLLGFHYESEQDFNDLLDLALTEAKQQITSAGFSYDVYAQADSGAELWTISNAQNEVVGLEPYFKGSEHSLNLDGIFPLQAWGVGRVQAWQGDCYPLVIDVPDAVQWDERLVGQAVRMNLCAFADEIDVYTDEASYEQAGNMWASQSLSPSGMFDEEATAHIIMTGVVKSLNTQVNAVTHAPIYAVQIDTFGGEMTALLGQAVAVGNVVSGSYWLTGRLAI